MTTWTPLEGLGGASLFETRLALHWAAQLPSAVGTTLAEAKGDYSHTALRWDGELGALVGAPIEGRRAGLRLSPAELLVIAEGECTARPLAGLTLADGLAFFGETFGSEALERPEHELPDHAVATGTTFGAVDAAAAAELARWFANGAALLEALAAKLDGDRTVRCWPHHFDIALSIPIDAGGGEDARSVGVGMTPGDGTSVDPYFYVTPWPYPEGDLPELPEGHWHREGWTGALLTGAELGAAADSGRAERFIDAAVRACADVLGTTPPF